MDNMKPKLLSDGVLKDITRIIVETNEENPATIAVITADNASTANGYRVRLKPRYENIKQGKVPITFELDGTKIRNTNLNDMSDFIKKITAKYSKDYNLRLVVKIMEFY